jgi:signal peptidase II
MTISDASSGARKRFLLVGLPVLLFGVLIDQTSKSWASLRPEEPRILVPGYLFAFSVENAGSFLGVGEDQARTSVISSLLAIACASLLVRIAYKDRGTWREADFVAGALVLAGIFGNTVDRIALGHVRDFLVTRAIPSLVFNVADVLVLVGGLSLLMARYWVYTHRRPELGFVSQAAT